MGDFLGLEVDVGLANCLGDFGVFGDNREESFVKDFVDCNNNVSSVGGGGLL